MTEQHTRSPEFGRGWWRATREFPVSADQVAVVRRWAGGLFSDSCDARGDCLLGLSEVATNAAVHGGGKLLRVRLEHGSTGMWCEVVEAGGTPGGVAAVDPDALAEMWMLTSLSDGGAVEIDAVREGGRGLALLVAMCGDRLEISQTPFGTTVRFGVVACRYQIRARYPDWGVVPPARDEPWLGIRAGFPPVEAKDLAGLLAAISEAERYRQR